jgi:UDPglucose 6-dehydrogenase
MSIESAEMVKHALNAFLATSVAFMNEIATICEQVGADAKEVERGLKSESRIGSRAYLSPGSAFAGGTLARDTVFLRQLGEAHDLPTRLFAAVKASNDAHRSWPQRRLAEILGDVRGQSVAIWGLTYKPGTDTLRRSPSVELCYWLESEGARIRAHDPVVRSLDPPLRDKVILHERALDALDGASALVVGTSWPEYSSVTADQIVSRMRHPLVLDANRFLAPALQSDPRIRYAAVGTPLRGGVVPNG